MSDTSASYQPPTKPSLWQRFKRLPLIARVLAFTAAGFVALLSGLLALGIVMNIVDPEGMEKIRAEQAQQREEEAAAEAEEEERKAEEEAEREAEEEAEREAEEEAELAAQEEEQEEEDDRVEVPDLTGMVASEARDTLDDLDLGVEYTADEGSVWNPDNWEVESSSPEAGEMVEEGAEVMLNVVRPAEPDPFEGMEIPEGIDDQVADMTALESLEDASVYFAEGDESMPTSMVYVDMEVEIGATVGTTCRAAQEATIDGLEFMRDRVTDDYDQVMFSFHVRGDEDATGNRPIIGLANATYDRETVESIDSGSVSVLNVWQARDSGSTSEECQ